MNPKNIMNPHPEDDAQQVGETNEFKGEATLPSVQSKTGEEDDQEVVKYRAKMYRFLQRRMKIFNFNNNSQVGDVKFLKNNQTQKIRLLVRQDKIKLASYCQSFDYSLRRIMPIKSTQTAQKSWIWACYDTSEEQTKICSLVSECRVQKNLRDLKLNLKSHRKIVRVNRT